jgi:hypothetical protein
LPRFPALEEFGGYTFSDNSIIQKYFYYGTDIDELSKYAESGMANSPATANDPELPKINTAHDLRWLPAPAH